MQKLNRFLNIIISVRDTSNGQTRYVHRSFRKCKVQDFKDRNYDINLEHVDYMLCPDIEFLENIMFLENSYQHQDN